MIKDVIKAISQKHDYEVTGGYWGRVGAMSKKYGDDVLIEAIEGIPPRAIPLTYMLNLVEKRAQYILENGELDEIADEILKE